MLSSTRRRILVATSLVAGVVVIGAGAYALTPDTSPTSSSPDHHVTGPTDDRPDGSNTGLATAPAPEDFREDLGRIDRSARIPAARASSVLSGLRPLVADAVVGTDGEPGDLRDAIDQRVDRLHSTADAIEATGDRSPPAVPTTSPGPALEPVLARVSTIVEQAPDVAEQLRDAADDTVAVTDAALGLHEVAADYAGSTAALPDTDDIDALLGVWNDEQDRLQDYRDAVEAVEHPAVQDHAAAHRDLVDTLAAVADEAAAALEDEDVDAYNDLLDGYEQRVQDPIEDLASSIQPTVDAAVTELESAEERTLGFLTELEQLRDDATLDT